MPKLFIRLDRVHLRDTRALLLHGERYRDWPAEENRRLIVGVHVRCRGRRFRVYLLGPPHRTPGDPMTPLEWAEIFEAGHLAIPSHPDTPAASALGLALYAMQQKAQEIEARRRADSQEPR